MENDTTISAKNERRIERNGRMLELLLKKKNADVTEVTINKDTETDIENACGCENFAYKKNLLFYKTECKYCRYARMIKADGKMTSDFVCTFATSSMNKTAI